MRIEVPKTAEGRRLDAFLAAELGSRSRAQRLISGGVVTVDGRQRAKRHLVVAGEAVEVGELPQTAPAAASHPVAGFTVVYADPALMVVDKPAGVVVHPGRGNATGTLVQALAGLAAGGEDPSRPGIVHRLDRNTSGLLVVARTETAHRRLREQLARRQMRREYLALVEGRPTARSGTIDAPIGRDRRLRTLMSLDTDHPREARTHFVVERTLAAHTLLRIRLETGRTHQIRVHLAGIGHPVCGDPDYGQAGTLGLDRQFLHAARLAFAHPLTGVQLDLRSELPEELQGALARAQPTAEPSGG
ncbi:MAG TPA: RluA family pseudouridine synthase [Solirubrobacteraceae bacterium]|nr:RluA family pseudouridine synthase [Solirubrobacteraceae bacterium]